MEEEKYDLSKIGEAIKKLLDEKGWTEEQFAERSLYTLDEIRAIEDGTYDISIHDVRYLAHKLDVYPYSIVLGEPVAKSSLKELSVQMQGIYELANKIIQMNEEYSRALEDFAKRQEEILKNIFDDADGLSPYYSESEEAEQKEVIEEDQATKDEQQDRNMEKEGMQLPHSSEDTIRHDKKADIGSMQIRGFR